MILLGVDTTTNNGSIALLDNDNIIGEYTLNISLTHSERLMPSIDRILADTGLTIHKIDGFAVSLGPGSFTGIRIGISVVRSLAQELNKEVVGVPTLDGLAYNLYPTQYLVCPIINALKDEVWTALYTCGPARSAGARKIKKLSPYQATAITGLIDTIHSQKDFQDTPVIFLGNAVGLYRSLLKKAFGKRAVFAPVGRCFPRGASIAEIGMDEFKRNKQKTWREILPLYIRKSEAEIRWRERNKK